MRYLIGFLCCSLFSLSALAAPQPLERKHTLGVAAGGGMANTTDESETDDAISHLGVFYEYKINNRYDLQVTVLDGASVCLIVCDDSEENYINYTSYQFSMKAKTQFSGRWNLFGRAGADIYHLEYTPYTSDYYVADEERKTISGIKPVVAFGGQFRAKNGFSLNIEYQYLSISQGDIRTATAFVGYSF